MMYSVSVNLLKEPTCNPEKIVENAAVFFNGITLEDEQAVKRLVNNMYRLTKVCNRNKRGAKLMFEWDEKSGKLFIYTGDGQCWYIIVWIKPIKHVLTWIDIDFFIESSVHNLSLNIFDQYLAEKNLEKEVRYERFS